ncbi:hypothetical protein G6F24_017849 [Rhizopus arrhizus]|nr:hypothetical protein G6F24_017849 [Rhizopus arrhizus]
MPSSARRHAFGQRQVQHAVRDRRHAVEAAHQPPFGALDQGAQTGALEQAQLERRVDFVVLDVQPRAGAAQAGGQPGGGRAEQGGFHHKDEVRPAGGRSQQ